LVAAGAGGIPDRGPGELAAGRARHSAGRLYHGEAAAQIANWTAAAVARWHADPFGFLRLWNEVPALFGSAPPATPPSTGTGVVVCMMG
jgi:hypothetical protein